MAHAIAVRTIPFEFADAIPPVWNPAMPEWSHMVNGASLVMPYLEPFLIKNLREALPLIDSADLRDDVRGFVGQEAQHYTNHRRYNEMLKRNGYPELAQVEDAMARGYKALASRSLNWRLAYTAGFETMTIGLTTWLIADRQRLFRNADPAVTSLVLWHMVEEIEHKSVAFDVFQAVCGSYPLRVFGLFYGAMHVAILSRRGYVAMLKRDGRWRDPGSRLRLWRMVGRFFANVAPALFGALRPRHHPDATRDPEWVRQWRDAYSTLPPERLPLLDTRAPEIAARFV